MLQFFSTPHVFFFLQFTDSWENVLPLFSAWQKISSSSAFFFFFIILSIINRAKLLADSAFQRSKHKLSVLLWGFFMAKFWERGDRRIKITCFSVMGKNKNLFMKID